MKIDSNIYENIEEEIKFSTLFW